MTYQECINDLKAYDKFVGKTVNSDDEQFKVQHALMCPTDPAKFAIFTNNYLNEGLTAEKSLAAFINEDLRIVLKAFNLTTKRVAFLEPDDVEIIG